MPNAPKLVLSGGICVVAAHLPLTKRKKSSPGLTVRSMPSRSMPHVPYRLAGMDGAPEVEVDSSPANAAKAKSAIRNSADSRFIQVVPLVWGRLRGVG